MRWTRQAGRGLCHPGDPMPKATPPAGRATTIGDHLPEAYFDEAAQTFSRAVSSTGSGHDFSIVIDGLRIRLRFAGKDLSNKLRPTLAHLETADNLPDDFTICCWDDEGAGTVMPHPVEWMFHHYAYSFLPVLTNSRFRTFYIDWFQALSCLDLESRVAYCCYRRASKLPMYEVSAPLRPIFNTILNQRGMQLVHASAVGTEKGTVLFSGPPLSGKSTMAIHCLLDGLFYQSDDICVLTSEEKPRSLSLYNIAKLREDSLPHFKSLHPVLSQFQEEDEKKSFFYVHHHFPEKVLKAAPICALLLPRIVDEPFSRLEPASGMDAIRGLIPWTIKEIPKADDLGEKIMLKAVSRLPSWHLLLGRDTGHTLKLIRSLLPAP